VTWQGLGYFIVTVWLFRRPGRERRDVSGWGANGEHLFGPRTRNGSARVRTRDGERCRDEVLGEIACVPLKK